MVETVSLTCTGTLLGTPFYMSPEQAMGEKHIDHRSDIWSLGVVLYRMLSGVLPTAGRTFAEVFKRVVVDPLVPIERLVQELPRVVSVLTRRMLARQPDERPWDMREVHAPLERYAAP